MSTQPIVRRRGRPMDRGPELRRLLSIAVAFALVFAVAFLLGHTGSGADVAEHLPPSLPRVATPVASKLPAAPAIELGVAQPPPPAPVVSPSRLAAPSVTTTPSIVTPTPASPSPQPTAPSPTPAVVTPPAKASPPASPPSKPSGSSTPSHGTAGSGAGRSFESSE